MRRELLTVSRDVDASPAEVWPVIADIGGYADHVTDLATTHVLEGSGEGAVRECVTTKDERWREDVTVWRPNETYEVEVRTDTYPVPLQQVFRRFTGVWSVEPLGDGARVTISFIADVRGGWPMWRLLLLGMGSHRANLDATLRSYQSAIAAGRVR